MCVLTVDFGLGGTDQRGRVEQLGPTAVSFGGRLPGHHRDARRRQQPADAGRRRRRQRRHRQQQCRRPPGGHQVMGRRISSNAPSFCLSMSDWSGELMELWSWNRSCVRRLRVEKKVHTLVLLRVWAPRPGASGVATSGKVGLRPTFLLFSSSWSIQFPCETHLLPGHCHFLFGAQSSLRRRSSG